MLKAEKIEHTPIEPYQNVKVTEMGNVTEVQYMSHQNCKATIRMLPGGEQYVIIDTGEVKDIVHHDTRADQRQSLYRTFQNARAIINTNVVDVSKVRWCTLTYAENMTDPKRLYQDFFKFNKRFQYYCEKHGHGKAEYIVMMEPQERGAWHCHLLYIWDCKAPFIPNEDFAKLWGHGFVKIKKLDNVDNVGAYLTAYLGDMELQNVTEATEIVQDENGNTLLIQRDKAVKIKKCEVEEDGKKVSKYYIKGARLHMYPANFNMIRYSKGIKKPSPYYAEYGEVTKKLAKQKQTYVKSISLKDEDGFEMLLTKEYYNSKRK